MKPLRIAALLTLGCLATTGCTSGISKPQNTPVANASSAAADQTPVTLTISSFFTGREKKVVDDVIADFTKTHPWVTVKHTGGQEQDTILQSIRGGKPPEIAINQDSSAIPSYCSSGTMIALNDYITRDQVDVKNFVDATNDYTQYKDKRCAVPMLSDAYALYYDKAAFAAAGIAEPPKTWDELADDAAKLTKKNGDGSLKTAGFMPLLDWNESNPRTWSPGWNLSWFNDDDKSQLATDPQWNHMLTWQKKMIDSYGAENLSKFRTSLGDEWSDKNPFYSGQTPMIVDGEWRVAFIDNDKPKMDYGVAPMPTSDPAQYGGGFISGTTLGIPKGTQHPEAAWQLIKYLSTDKEALVKLTLGLKNVPTTKDVLADPRVSQDPHFKQLIDIAMSPHSRSVRPTLAGTGPDTLLASELAKWQNDKATDPTAFLAQVSKQIDAQVAQATGPK